MPWFLQVAIEHALTVLGWYENLPKDEVPPERLWEDPEGLEQWWARIEDKRESGMPASNTTSSSSDDGESIESMGPQMVENDLARALKQG